MTGDPLDLAAAQEVAAVVPGGQPWAPKAPPPTVAQAAELVAAAHRALADAQEAEAAARRTVTACLNDANTAQKLLDDAVLRLRSDAPFGTDWKSTKGEPVDG